MKGNQSDDMEGFGRVLIGKCVHRRGRFSGKELTTTLNAGPDSANNYMPTMSSGHNAAPSKPKHRITVHFSMSVDKLV
jgi:hypothetical protein